MARKVHWSAKVLTLFPEMFPGLMAMSLAGKALEKHIWSLEALDIRSFARDKHATVDDTPYGGGTGMVMRADVLDAAIDAALSGNGQLPLIYLSPRGRPLDQKRIRELARGPGVVLLCGRYEGIDERLLSHRRIEEISIGDYVLSGGEAAAMVVLDACVRLLPGVIGKEASTEDESFETGLLEYPHYTKPRRWQGMDVPEPLLSGAHERINQWRLNEAERITRQRRPDLWERYAADHK